MKMKEKSGWKGDGSEEMAALGDQLRETRKMSEITLRFLECVCMIRSVVVKRKTENTESS